jgi:sarcosine oxidase subunit alpha
MTDAGRRPSYNPTRLAEVVASNGAIGRSHRLHRPRGGFCARGYCQQCPLEVGGLACETPAGLGVPRRGLDPIRPLGWFGERMPPWFYETRFLRPRAARQPTLELLRRLSAAYRLPVQPALAAPPGREIAADVVVVGGGPAGVAAAVAAGATRTSVLIMTRGPLGGSLPLERDVADRLARDIDALEESDATILERTMCLGRYGEDEGLVAFSAADGPAVIRAERLIVASGAYDRSILVVGADLPGVVGLRGFQLLAAQGAFGGKSIGVVGTGAELRRAVATASAFDLTLEWIAGARSDADVPAEVNVHRTAVRAIRGRHRARGVTLLDGTTLDANIVVLATTQPTFELQIQLGAEPSFVGTPPIIRPTGPTTSPVLTVGEAAGWLDPPSTAIRATEAVKAWLSGGDPTSTDPVAPGPLIAPPTGDAVVCVCEDVRQRDIERAIADGFDDVELVKRRSGATTGACQGKLCMPLLAEAFAAHGLPPAITTVRPPIRPIRIADLGGLG